MATLNPRNRRNKYSDESPITQQGSASGSPYWDRSRADYIDVAHPQGADSQQITQMLWDILRQWGVASDNFARQDTANLMNWLMTLNERSYNRGEKIDDRAYNEQMLQEQRAYDSPSALLGRLMQTGMSRQAALQLLNGADGSSALTSPSSASGSPLHPMQMDANQDTQERMQMAGLAINTAMSLISAGISAPAALASASLNSANAIAQEQANKAQESSAKLNSALFKRAKAGNIDLSKMSFDSVADMFADDEELSPLFNDLFSTPQGYVIGSANYNTRFGNNNAMTTMRMLYAQERAARLQPDLIQQEILNSQAKFEEIFANIDLLHTQENIMEEKLPFEISLLESQTESNSSQAELSRSSSKQIDVVRQISAHALRRLNLTASDMDATALANAARELKYAQALGSDEYMNTALDNILKNEQMRNSLAVFNTLRLNNLNELVADNPELLNLHNLCNELNLGGLFYNYVENSGKLAQLPKSYADFIATFGMKHVMPGKPINILQATGVIQP